MAKTITFTYDGTDYTLEYTKRTVQQMEREGFNIREIDSKLANMIPQLFSGSFKAHHRFTKSEVIDAIYNSIPHKDEFVTKLVEMYNAPIEALMDEPEETEGNVVEWNASF